MGRKSAKHGSGNATLGHDEKESLRGVKKTGESVGATLKQSQGGDSKKPSDLQHRSGKHIGRKNDTETSGVARSSRGVYKSKGNLMGLLHQVADEYLDKTSQHHKIIDTFLAFLMFVGGVQFIHCLVAGNYPFNAFLSGFSLTVGQFVLAVSLRIQTNEENSRELKSISKERAFADFIFASLLSHFFCINFIN